MKLTPYGRQFIDNKDIYYVSNALKNNLITTGPYVKKFEDKIQNILTAKYVISCNSGTAALHLALKAINLKNNDVIIMPAINFIAAYNMARLMNAKIFLADVDPFTGQMTPKTLLECVKQNKLKKIKAIVTMYLGGYPENVINFFNLKKRLKCFLIEDACHALGSKYYFNKKLISVGSCKHSDISTFSFHPVKTITSGEGGAVLTNNKFFYDRMITLRSHGIIKDSNYHWKYNLNEGGYNYRLSDINCALGYSQLKKINKCINYRKKIFNFYKLKLEKVKNLISLPFYIKKKQTFLSFVYNFN
jgi:dTDP-4-amino-4,6-dideoxygalactose transaminase